MPELIGLCDRILVLREGHRSAEFSSRADATQEKVLEAATKTSERVDPAVQANCRSRGEEEWTARCSTRKIDLSPAMLAVAFLSQSSTRAW